ncbi:NAD-glutamate dehydrogenase [Auritidibacter ignavus]|uniref:NAD-glutamate dehydrogenase n=1 Tax=Auritidibacter ignavus TaxID=678932 RepID=UPI0024470536|nr:NAD-glutamate dehydrogenase [Auritidibacter ignavus]WGH83991.1 NAD-glutamate dehydrogenase [Auritidibacter ignavus]
MTRTQPLWTKESTGTEELAQAYFHDLSAEDREKLGDADARSILDHHLELAMARPAHEASVDIHNAGHVTTVYVVQQDMQFLVDSVTAVLSGSGHGIELINHPMFIVHRDAETAELQSVFPVPSTGPRLSGETAENIASDALLGPKGTTVSIESWMSIRLYEKVDEQEVAELEQQLSDSLEDVSLVARDQEKMRTQALQVADQLRQQAPTSTSGVDETAALLEWMVKGGFIFQGYRRYDLEHTADGDVVLAGESANSLGILSRRQGTGRRPLTQSGQQQIQVPNPLIVTKTNAVSRVQNQVPMDYVAIKTYDENGKVTGENRFIGLFTAKIRTTPVQELPVARETARAVVRLSGFGPHSHSEQQLLDHLETYPREELLQSGSEQVWATLESVLHIGQRRRSAVYVHQDPFGRYARAMVYLPKDRYNTSVRKRIQNILMDVLHGESLEYQVLLGEAVLARVTFRIKIASQYQDTGVVESLDMSQLRHDLAQAIRSWKEGIDIEAVAVFGEESGVDAAQIWDEAFPPGYRVRYEVEDALEDISRFTALNDNEPTVYAIPDASDSSQARVKIYSKESKDLSDVLPVFRDMGLRVIDEYPFMISPSDQREFFLYDLGVQAEHELDLTVVASLLEETAAATLIGTNSSDGFNRLGIELGLPLGQVAILRAYAHYLRQLSFPSSLELVATTLLNNPVATSGLVELFATKFDPQATEAEGEESDGEASQARVEATEQARDKVLASLDDVASLDADRILRAFITVIDATVRTNAYLDPHNSSAARGGPRLSFKILPQRINFAPQPRPAFEIWVHSPQVSGTHLRYDKIARGGLRWSDRAEDFRTEVLGLVQTQQVKNGVIVPAGAKGGFFAHGLPDPSQNRNAWFEAGRDAYQTFIRGLLDLTDNQQLGAEETTVITPERVIRHDGTDPYLVVAADKGTASFSDTANAISAEYGFWLADAFASGGSVGYDHKQMGITARGAWESVRSHAAALELDADHDPITVVGIGDMSGDVFGNGLLRSQHLKLIAAFNHLHIFIDPNPDPEASYTERRRLYDTPRSTWADYDRDLISAGGGVFDRGSKSIEITEQMREALGLEESVTSASGEELIHYILQAPVDLLYNGGIGTYIKAESETSEDVGDRANDVIRINGSQVRARIIGEGGNLGATQAGRVEAAAHGVRVNTDAVDNSAGVDASDHEVNIKILLENMIASGDLTAENREELLASMTDEVGHLVLDTNASQNRLLRVEESLSLNWMPALIRYVSWLEEHGGLNRELESIPSHATLNQRLKDGKPVYTPELSILLAYAKNTLARQLQETDIVTDPWFSRWLVRYFPERLQETGENAILQHPLGAQIIATRLANHVIDSGGITVIFRAEEETAADLSTLVRAFIVAEEIYQLPALQQQINDLPATLDHRVRMQMLQDLRRLTDRLMRWLIHHQLTTEPMHSRIERFQDTVAAVQPKIGQLLTGDMHQAATSRATKLREAGVGDELAETVATLFESYSLLDIAGIADRFDQDPAGIARVYFHGQDYFDAEKLLELITDLSRRTRWDALARVSIREDLYGWLSDLASVIVEQTAEAFTYDTHEEVSAAVEDWRAHHKRRVHRVKGFFDEIRAQLQPEEGEHTDLAMLTVVLHRLRTLIV